MPTRLISEKLLEDRRLNKLSFPAETFFRRLLQKVDDYGRYPADPCILRSGLYPLQIDRVSREDVLSWLGECLKAALVRVYRGTDGEDYLELCLPAEHLGNTRSGKHTAQKSRYPDPSPEPSLFAPECVQIRTDTDFNVREPAQNAREQNHNPRERPLTPVNADSQQFTYANANANANADKPSLREGAGTSPAAASQSPSKSDSPLPGEPEGPETRATQTLGRSDVPKGTNIPPKGTDASPSQPEPLEGGGKKPRKPPDDPHSKLIAYFVAKWRRAHGAEYVFQKGKDGSAAKCILQAAGGELNRALRIVDRYFASDDRFYADKGHPLALLWGQINQFVAEPANGHAVNGMKRLKGGGFVRGEV